MPMNKKKPKKGGSFQPVYTTLCILQIKKKWKNFEQPREEVSDSTTMAQIDMNLRCDEKSLEETIYIYES